MELAAPVPAAQFGTSHAAQFGTWGEVSWHPPAQLPSPYLAVGRADGEADVGGNHHRQGRRQLDAEATAGTKRMRTLALDPLHAQLVWPGLPTGRSCAARSALDLEGGAMGPDAPRLHSPGGQVATPPAEQGAGLQGHPNPPCPQVDATSTA